MKLRSAPGGRARLRASAWHLAIWVVPLAFFAVFFAYPVVTLIAVAFSEDGGWNLAPLADALSDADMLGVIWFTVWQAALSTVLTLGVALPGAWVLANYRFPGRSLIETLAVVAFVMPTVVVATAISTTMSDDGPLAWLLPQGSDRGLAAIFVAHVYLNVAIVLRMVGSFWRQLDRRQEQAAVALGASPARVLWSVTLPRLLPVILASASIVYLFTFTSFGVVLLLGEFGQATLEVEIQRQVLFLFDLPLGAALSIVQMVMVMVLLLVQSRLTAKLTREQGMIVNRPLPRPTTPRDRMVVWSFVVLSLLFLAGPMLLVLGRALRNSTSYGFDNFVRLSESRRGSILFVPPIEAIFNSLMFAVAATMIAVFIGGLAAFAIASRDHSASESLLLLPLGVSAVTLGFGMLVAFDSAPLNFRGSAWLVPIAQALVAIPFVVRALLPALRAVRSGLRQAAAVMGASPVQVIRYVDLPLVSRALLVAIGFSFAISLGEFGATVFVARGDHPTIPIAIYRFLSQPGEANQGQAMALSSVLILITAAVVALTDRFRSPGGRDV
jgi:thiamine transport system permease protein